MMTNTENTEYNNVNAQFYGLQSETQIMALQRDERESDNLRLVSCALLAGSSDTDHQRGKSNRNVFLLCIMIS